MNSKLIGRCFAAALFALTLPAWGQTPRKPPVAPTQPSKPPRVILTHKADKFTVQTLTFLLENERRLRGANIKVTASANRVGLYGTVKNAVQKRVALQRAQSMQGVTHVSDHLRIVNPSPAPAVLADNVRRTLRNDAGLTRETITVKGYRSVVTLSGTVGTLYAKRRAIALAHAVPHVAVVQDHLAVQEGATGDGLASAVRAALSRDPLLAKRTFTVLAKGGYVYLRGTVYSKTARRHAGDVAARVPGVTGLSNSVAVLPARLRRFEHGRR